MIVYRSFMDHRRKVREHIRVDYLIVETEGFAKSFGQNIMAYSCSLNLEETEQAEQTRSPALKARIKTEMMGQITDRKLRLSEFNVLRSQRGFSAKYMLAPAIR